MSIRIDSTNRGPAKKLLTFCGMDSKQVRTMTVRQLADALQRCLNNGLITDAQVRQHLGGKSDWKNDGDDSGRGENDGRHDKTDDEEVDSDTDESGDASGTGETDNDSDGDATGDGEADESSNGDNESDSESESESSDADSDSESETDDDNESESNDDSDGDGDDESDDESDDDEMSEQDDDSGSKAADDNDDDESDDDESESDSESEGDDEQDDEQDDDDDDSEQKHSVFNRVLKYISAGLNVALVGPAGTGKSYIARQVAEHTGRKFYVNGAMLSKYDLIGYNDAHGTYHPTPAYDAFHSGGLHCFDEMDASSPDAVVSFNGMTDDQPFFTFPCGQVEQHADYVAIACMNTWGNGASADYVGRYKQDAASMTRFVKVYVGYDENIERKIAGKAKDILRRVQALRACCDELGIRHIVSTRMIVQAKAARAAKATKAEIDADILFSGLDDNAIAQLKRAVNAKTKAGDDNV